MSDCNLKKVVLAPKQPIEEGKEEDNFPKFDPKRSTVFLYSVLTDTFLKEGVYEKDPLKFFTAGLPFVAHDDEEAKKMFISHISGERIRLDHSPRSSERQLRNIDFNRLFLVRLCSFQPFFQSFSDPVLGKCNPVIIYDPRLKGEEDEDLVKSQESDPVSTL